MIDHLGGVLLAMFRQGRALRLAQTASSLAFLSLLALVPVFSIALSVLTALPMFERLRDALQKFLAGNLFLPSFADTVVSYLNQFAARASELSALGALVFSATAFTALLTIDRTLNLIWATDRPRPLTRRMTLYWTLLTLGPLLLAASLAVNGLIVSDWVSELKSRSIQRLWFNLVNWLTAIGGLTLLYRLVPNAPVRWRDAGLGAVLATVVLELLKDLLGLYMVRLPTYTVIYGAFAVLPIFLLWLFTFWLTVLLGALCAANLRYWGSGSRVHARLSHAELFETGASILVDLAGRSGSGNPLVAVTDLRQRLHNDPQRAEEIGRRLSRLGYLHRHWLLGQDGHPRDADHAVWDEHWSLAAPAAELSLRALFESVWIEGAGGADSQAASARAAARLKRIDSDLFQRFSDSSPLLTASLATLAAAAKPVENG